MFNNHPIMRNRHLSEVLVRDLGSKMLSACEIVQISNQVCNLADQLFMLFLISQRFLRLNFHIVIELIIKIKSYLKPIVSRGQANNRLPDISMF